MPCFRITKDLHIQNMESIMNFLGLLSCSELALESFVMLIVIAAFCFVYAIKSNTPYAFRNHVVGRPL